METQRSQTYSAVCVRKLVGILEMVYHHLGFYAAVSTNKYRMNTHLYITDIWTN